MTRTSTKSSSPSPDSKVDTAEARDRILNDEDFIYSKRFEYSLAKVEERYPDGVPHRLIAAMLLITEEDVQAHYDRIVRLLRAKMGVTI